MAYQHVADIMYKACITDPRTLRYMTAKQELFINQYSKAFKQELRRMIQRDMRAAATANPPKPVEQRRKEAIEDRVLTPVPNVADILPLLGCDKVSISAVVERTEEDDINTMAFNEFNGYVAEVSKAQPELSDNPFIWWETGTRKIMFPRVYSIAMKYLVISPVSVEVERLFSSAGQIVSPLRSRLTVEMVDNLVSLRTNMRTLSTKKIRLTDAAEVQSAQAAQQQNSTNAGAPPKTN